MLKVGAIGPAVACFGLHLNQVKHGNHAFLNNQGGKQKHELSSSWDPLKQN